MIPGTTTKLSESVVASAASVDAKSDILKVTGTTQINTIIPYVGSFSTIIWLVPVDGAITLGTSGNILIGGTAAQNKATVMVFVRTLGKWVINT